MLNTKSITISSQLVMHTMAGAMAKGVDMHALLASSGIDEAVFWDKQGRLPVDSVVKLHHSCSWVMNDEVNGLLESPLRAGIFRMMALTAVHTSTLGDALQRCVDFINLFENSFVYSIVQKRRQTELILERIPGHAVRDDHAISLLMSVLHRFLGWLANDRLMLNQVMLDYSPPEYKEEFQYIFYGAPVLYNQAVNSISFDRHYLDHPVVQTEASAHSYVRRAPMDIYLPLDAGGRWTMDVRKRLKQAFTKNKLLLQFDQLASEMDLNPQTLRRRLKAEATSFDTIKAQLRRDIAIHRLGDAQYSIEAIAEDCGYTEPSAFIRAFKSWTGFTPLQFRKGLDTSS